MGMRHRRPFAWLLALALVTVVLQPTPAVAAPTASTPITYVCDAIGRLTAVVDPTAASNGIAKYAYDDVGNLLSITRQSATTTRILEFHGKRGGTGTPVTIYGSSFNTTAAQNQVRFNGSAGTIATVTAATATTLQVTVPAGAPDGPLWVKNLGTNKTATSTATYDVIGSGTPTISGFSPTSGDAGVQVVINGTNFDPSAPARNNVFFNGTRAQVVSATASALTVKVPPFVAPGKISVQTADGEAVSTADFTAPPQGFVAMDIESTTRLSLGQTSALTVNTANKVAIGLFDGQQNHELFIDVTGATTALYPTVRIFDPFGRLLSATPIAPTGGTVPTQLLPFDGTYTIMFDPQSTNTGQLNFKPVDATHSTTAIVPGGASVPFSTATMGQDAWFTFDGTVGQRISAMVTSSTYPCCPWIRLFEPTGRDVGGAAQIASSSKFFDVQTLTWPGRHYFEFDPSGKDVGSATIQVYDVPADPNYPIAIGGSVVTGSNTAPGQNFTLSFAGNAGQNLTLTMSGGNLACCNTNKVKVLRPDGSVLKSGNDVPPSTQSITSIVLDTTGTHTITYDLRDELVGTRNFQLTLVSGFAAPRPYDASEPSRSGPAAPTDEPPASTRTEVVPPGEVGSTSAGSADWIPDPDTLAFETHWPDPVELPSLEAEPGVTALAGRVLELDGSPLQHVSLEIDGIEVESDATGRFLLAGIPAGKQVLEIDGASANSSDASYGFYEAQVHLAPAETNELGWTIWMTELDLSTTIQVPDVLDREVVLRTPDIPGFEVHIPEGSRLIGEDGEPVNELSLTAIPVDRPPFPLPPFGFPMYFTVQPGGTYVEGEGAWVVYPNLRDFPPGVRVPFSHYDPDDRGWYEYGYGHVTQNGRRIVPSRTTQIWAFTGGGHLSTLAGPALSASCIRPPTSGSGAMGDAIQFVTDPPADPTVSTCGADPVDLNTGLFAHGEVDLRESGLPFLELRREYRQNDSNTYSFGLGTGTPYDMYLYTTDNSASLDLAIPGERTVHLVRISGTTVNDFVFEAQSTPGPFFRARAYFTPDSDGVIHGWNLYLRDGTHLVFGLAGVLTHVIDTFGNRLLPVRNTGSSTLQGLVGYPSGRWISLTRSNGLVASASDSLGRTVAYTYEHPTGSLWRLKTITDANQVGQPNPKSTVLTWDASTVVNPNPSTAPSPGTYLNTIVDPRGNTAITNHYDAQGRIDQQNVAGGGQWLTDYTGGTQCPGKTKVTDPDGNVRCVGFDPSGFASTTIDAQGTADQRTQTYVLDPGSHRVSSETDSFHTRTTSYGYDGFGNVTSVSRLDGTAGEVTTTFDWSSLGRLKSVTDPLSHQTAYGYDAVGCLTSVTDPSTNQTTLTCNQAGQVATVIYPGAAPPAQRTMTFAYAHGDLISVTDPNGRITRRFSDAAGRVLVSTDPFGYRTTNAYDALGNLTSVTDAQAKTTSFLYDENSNLTRITDALTRQTNFTYFASNLLQTRTDALSRQESFTYDPKGNLATWTDRKNQVTEYRYNAYDRPTFIGYKRQGSPGSYTYESTLTLGYDGGWRLTSVADSTTGAGTITRAYDDLDRLTTDTQPQGTVTYTYWDDGRRKTMTAGNQAVTNYSWYANGTLQQITRGAATVGFTYLPNGLPNVTTLPSGVTETYGYSNANELTQIVYAQGANIGTIAYGYDGAGRRSTVFDTWARTGLPTATTSNAVYDAANQISSWNGTANTHDANGNVTAAGSQTFTWNARNQLTATSGGTASFVYDGLGRRIKKVVSGTTNKFLYDWLNPVQEQNNGGTVTSNLITGLGLDQTYQRSLSGVNYDLMRDALGSTVGLYSAGAVSHTFTYQPYGAATQTGSGTHPYRFTGREWDGATNLQFNRARYYNPTWGRFIGEDPTGFLGSGPNLYWYATNSPTLFVDPLGLESYTPLDLATEVVGCAVLGRGFISLLGGLGGLFVRVVVGAIGCALGALLPRGVLAPGIPPTRL